jgi:SAM-dependent methyltransferase
MDKEILLSEAQLEWSAVVANNAMNRERKAKGVNSYEKDIGFDPIKFIENRSIQHQVSWADLCCGKGNALIEAAQYFKNKNWVGKIDLTGIDLVDYFSDAVELPNLKFDVLNLYKWQPKITYDLITIVHGLHYVGDKIGLIIKSAAALKENGVFIGNLDIKDIEIKVIRHLKS